MGPFIKSLQWILSFFVALPFLLLTFACAAPVNDKGEVKLAQAEKDKPSYKRNVRSERKLVIERPNWEEYKEEDTSTSGETAPNLEEDATADTPETPVAEETDPKDAKEEAAKDAPPEENKREDPFAALEGEPWEEEFVQDMEKIKENKKQRSELTGDLVKIFPLADEIQLGEGVAARTLSNTPELDHRPLWEYITFIGLSLAEQCQRNDLAYYFIVLDAADEINAFAAPGGFIFITSGAIRFCQNEAELASILAHELGHVSHRHGIKMLDLSKYRLLSQSMVHEMDEAFGDSEFFDLKKSMDPRFKKIEEELSAVADQCFNQILNPYSQEMEFEADSESLRVLSDAGYNPYAAVTLLERLREKMGDTPAYERALHSHPPTSERISHLKKWLSSRKNLKQSGTLHEERFQDFVKSLEK